MILLLDSYHDLNHWLKPSDLNQSTLVTVFFSSNAQGYT